jgi:hypothetical protein
MVLEKIYNFEMRDFLDTQKEKSATKKIDFPSKCNKSVLNVVRVSNYSAINPNVCSQKCGREATKESR